MNDRHPHDSLHPPDTKVGTATTSNFKHDDGNIHRASPIRGLPPEHSKHANIGFDQHDDLPMLTTGLNSMQQGALGNQAGNSTSMRPAQPTGNMGTGERNLAHPQTKQKGKHTPQASLPQPMAPDRSAAVMAINEQLDHKDHLQTRQQRPNPPPTNAIDEYDASPPTGSPNLEERLGDKLQSCRSMDQVRPQKVTPEAPWVCDSNQIFME